MKAYRLDVMISLASAVKQYRVEELLNAVETSASVGPLKVEVALYNGDNNGTVAEARKAIADKSETELKFILTGDAILADESDLADSTTIDARLAGDIGEVGKAGERVSCNLLYTLNHDGLPLLYNGAIRDTFAKERTGRASAKKASNEMYQAMAWLTKHDPALFASTCAKGPEAVTAAWVAAGRP